MKILSGKKTFLVTVILTIISVSILLYAYSTGITGRTHKNGIGCTCHNPNPSSNVIVAIVGPDTLKTGEMAAYSVTISGGPLVRAGTDIAVSAGTLSPISSDLRLDPSDGELTHTLPKAPSGGKVTFTFSYTAPAAAGTITMYANGNSVNFNGVNDTGDQWNFAPDKKIAIVGVTGIDENIQASRFILNQNYPNPFNPTTQIEFSLAKSGIVKLEVYNSLGYKIKTLVSQFMHEGTYSYTFDASGFASGIYYYKLVADNFSQIKKMVLLK